MATKQSTVDFLLEQTRDAGDVRARKMFGEYGFYCNDKIVALICDDQLFIKPTDAGKEFLKDKLKESSPYPGAKNYYLVSEDFWGDKDFLTELINITANTLPIPKPKKLKS